MSAKRKSRKSNRKKVGKLVHTMTLSGFLSKFCIAAAIGSSLAIVYVRAGSLCSLLPTPAWDFFRLLYEHAERYLLHAYKQ